MNVKIVSMCLMVVVSGLAAGQVMAQYNRSTYRIVYEGGDPTDKDCQVYLSGKGMISELNVPVPGKEGECDDLSGYDFSEKYLATKNFKGANFSGAGISGTDFNHANLDGAQFIEIEEAVKPVFTGASITKADFANSNFLMADFRDAVGIRPTFSNAIMTSAKFQGAKLTNANFWGLQGSRIRFEGANLKGASFMSANLASPFFSGVDLTNSNFQFANVSNADFSNSNLTGSDFTGAKLYKADFRGATFAAFKIYDRSGKSNFKTKRAVSFYKADLREANLRGTDLSEVDLRQAVLTGALIDDQTKLPFSDSEIEAKGIIISGSDKPIHSDGWYVLDEYGNIVHISDEEHRSRNAAEFGSLNQGR